MAKKLPRILTLLAAVFLVLSVTTILTGLFLWNTLTGRGEWARVKSDLLARGEKLSLVELAPPPVPAADNFFADSLWEEVYPSRTGEKPGEPLLPKGKRQLDVLKRPVSHPEFQQLAKNYSEFSLAGSSVHHALSKLRLAERDADPSRQRRLAEFTLAALQYAGPVMTRITELARRPDANFPLNYEDGLRVSLTHIDYLVYLQYILGQRVWAEVTLGDRAAALGDTHTMLRLARIGTNEPVLLIHLIWLNQENLALAAIGDGIKAHVWTDEDLSDFERILASTNVVPSLVYALRGERGSFHQLVESLEKNPQAVLPPNPGEDSMPRSTAAGIGSLVWVFAPGNQVFFEHTLQGWLDNVEKAPAQGLNARSMPMASVIAANTGILRYFKALSILSLFNIGDPSPFFAYTQDQVQLTRVACALERYRLAHGEYPEDLSALVPDFLTALPVDTVTLNDLHYRRDEKEGFLLWTVGWNEKDDNGQEADLKANGDWVWGKPITKKK